jgi:hypothetical protein
LSGNGGGERLERAHPFSVGFFAENPNTAEDLTNGSYKQTDLDETEFEGEVDPGPNKKRNQAIRTPQDAIELLDNVGCSGHIHDHFLTDFYDWICECLSSE